MLGEDGHGYCKTFGAGVPPSVVYSQSSCSSHAASSSSTTNEITRQVREATQEIEQRLTVEIEHRLSKEIEKKLRGEIEQRFTGEIERKLDEMFVAHLEHMGAQMALFEPHGGVNETEQFRNVASRQPIIRESLGDDYIQDGEQVASLQTCSPRLDG